MRGPIIVDTRGLLKALARIPDQKPSFPEYRTVLANPSVVIVPAVVLAEVGYFLRDNRTAMRKLIADVFDPATRYEYELPLPSDVVRAVEFDAEFKELGLRAWDRGSRRRT